MYVTTKWITSIMEKLSGLFLSSVESRQFLAIFLPTNNMLVDFNMYRFAVNT